VHKPLLQAFPFPSTLGEVTLHPLSLACMFVYSSHGKWVFPPLLWSFPPNTALTSFLLLIAGWCCCSCQPAWLFTAPVEGGSSPLSCGVFLPLPFSQAFLLLVAGHVPPLPPEPLQPGPVCLFTVLGRISLPPLRRSVCPTLFAMCLYYSYCLLLSFSFVPWWGSVCPGGYADLAQGCLWKYRILLSSPCPRLPNLSGHGRVVAWGPSWFLRLT
jgi:hypothetical protein